MLKFLDLSIYLLVGFIFIFGLAVIVDPVGFSAAVKSKKTTDIAEASQNICENIALIESYEKPKQMAVKGLCNVKGFFTEKNNLWIAFCIFIGAVMVSVFFLVRSRYR